MPIPSDLKFDAGEPPSQWLDLNRTGERLNTSNTIVTMAIISSLWETTMGLIHNEKVIDPDRFLAMVDDHHVSGTPLGSQEHGLTETTPSARIHQPPSHRWRPSR